MYGLKHHSSQKQESEFLEVDNGYCKGIELNKKKAIF
jgi:hypothetical protein